METGRQEISRRATIKGAGLFGAAAVLGATGTGAASPIPFGSTNTWSEIARKVVQTPFVDTHEHLLEEKTRLNGKSSRIQANDWSFLLSHYLDSDLFCAGMTEQEMNRFKSAETDPIAKWNILEPYWPAVRNTGYGQAVSIAFQRLYDVDELSAETVSKIQSAYEQLIRPGFYKKVLVETANLDSCQVNSLEGSAFQESDQPLLLMQDISFLGMHIGPEIGNLSGPAGIDVNDLSDWHKVIDWWFDKYAKYAVAVKSQAAYGRDIDYADVPAEQAEPIFKRILNGEKLSREESKPMEDHLFWYAVRKATACNLPVKLHTGYYAGHGGRMPLSRLMKNPDSAVDLCRIAPETTFIFMHIGYPFYEEMISVAKHYPNAHIDMCWAWIVSPSASTNFLKSYLGAAPANKVLTFGGDYIPVEPVVGHAAIARTGVICALGQLCDEGWLDRKRALDLVEPILCGNARRIFHLDEKRRYLEKVPWKA